MSRRRYSSVSVSVDVSDVLADIDTEDLRDELQSRAGSTSISEAIGSDWFDRLRFYLDRGDIHGARAMVVSEEVQSMIGREARAAQYASMVKAAH